MTYFIEKPTYKTTEFKIRFDKPTEKKIPCKVISRQGDRVLIEYSDRWGTAIKWIDQNQIIEK